MIRRILRSRLTYLVILLLLCLLGYVGNRMASGRIPGGDDRPMIESGWESWWHVMTQ